MTAPDRLEGMDLVGVEITTGTDYPRCLCAPVSQ